MLGFQGADLELGLLDVRNDFALPTREIAQLTAYLLTMLLQTILLARSVSHHSQLARPLHSFCSAALLLLEQLTVQTMNFLSDSCYKLV